MVGIFTSFVNLSWRKKALWPKRFKVFIFRAKKSENP